MGDRSSRWRTTWTSTSTQTFRNEVVGIWGSNFWVCLTRHIEACARKCDLCDEPVDWKDMADKNESARSYRAKSQSSQRIHACRPSRRGKIEIIRPAVVEQSALVIDLVPTDQFSIRNIPKHILKFRRPAFNVATGAPPSNSPFAPASQSFAIETSAKWYQPRRRRK